MNENKKSIKTHEIIKLYDYKVLNEQDSDMEREITGASMHRLGLELTGAVSNHGKWANIITWGTKEAMWVKEIGFDQAKKLMKNALSLRDVPLILLSSGFSSEVQNVIVEVASSMKIPVASTSAHLSELSLTLGSYLSEFFAVEVRHHGTLMIINGVGVMIIGKSGIGKSEAALELIQAGHSFVTDDSVSIKTIAGRAFGTSPLITKGMLEARGIGIINIPHVYGSKVLRNSSEIELVVELVIQEKGEVFDRLGTESLIYRVSGTTIPQTKIPVNKGRSVSNLIIAATNSFLAKKNGVNPLDIIANRSGNN